jgi:bacteriocin biosynthesis cyclodehydratase domain-containing protein
VPELQPSAEDVDAYREQIDFMLWMKSPHRTRLEIRSQYEEGLRAQTLIEQSSVRVFGEGRAADHLLSLLQVAGVGYRTQAHMRDQPSVEGVSLNVYCPDQFDEAAAQRLNQTSIRAEVPILFYRARGLEVECGPLVIPPSTSCYRCLVVRRAGLLSPLERVWLQRTEIIGALRFPLVVEFLALEAMKYLARLGEPSLQGRLWRFSLHSGETAMHTILRIPRCPDCGTAEECPPVKIWASHA